MDYNNRDRDKSGYANTQNSNNNNNNGSIGGNNKKFTFTSSSNNLPPPQIYHRSNEQPFYPHTYNVNSQQSINPISNNIKDDIYKSNNYPPPQIQYPSYYNSNNNNTGNNQTSMSGQNKSIVNDDNHFYKNGTNGKYTNQVPFNTNNISHSNTNNYKDDVANFNDSKFHNSNQLNCNTHNIEIPSNTNIIDASNNIVVPSKKELKSSKNDTKYSTKSLGTWIFDRKTKRRKYIALTGKIYIGVEAINKAKYDKICEENPSKTARNELHYRMSMISPDLLVNEMRNFKQNRSKNLSFLSMWGLPEKVVQRYEKEGRVTQLFEWQLECLTVNNGNVKNLIYSAPTSGGKTLVSEILMLRKISEKKGTIFFIVPFVSLAEEKTNYFQSMWQDMNIGVRAYHGDESNLGSSLPNDVEVAVCTIEKANILLNQLLDENRESQLVMVVIDEIHMLSDSHRGFLLEVLLSKIVYIMKDTVQIVGMSATLPNMEHLAGWLGADLYKTSYRPVNLDVKICMSSTLYKVSSPELEKQIITSKANESFYNNSNKINLMAYNDDYQNHMIYDDDSNDSFTNNNFNQNININIPKTINEKPKVKHYLNYHSTLEGVDKKDVDGLHNLCFETVLEKKSVMVFCNSKNRCEVCASNISEYVLAKSGCINNRSANIDSSNVIGGKMLNATEENDMRIFKGRKGMLEDLSQCQVGLCPVLKQTIAQGVAYHHAGLTLDERKIIESGFKNGFISVLCTTSTLSAGVNLPAHRVIVRSPKMGNSVINVASFRQMCGRAGRMGLDSTGEAILMIAGNNEMEKEVAINLVTADLDPLISTLHIGNGGGLEKLLLEMISCNRLKKEQDVSFFIACTLMKVQQPVELVSKCTFEALTFLKRGQFILVSKDGSLSPSQLGKATTLSGIAPKEVIVVLKPLEDACSRLILKGGLHPVFLVTPPLNNIEPDWNNYEKILDTLYKEHPDAKAVADFLGISHGQLCTYAFANPSLNDHSERVKFYRRFYNAIVLFILIQEWPITRVASMTKSATRGQLQQLQKDASIFCNMVVTFCKKLNWEILGSCLDDYSSRLNFGVHKDILPLVRIGSEITNIRARIFFKNKICNPKDIISAGIKKITQLLIDTLPFYSRDAIDITNNNNVNSSELHNRRELTIDSCERLAKKIISRSKEVIREEINKLNSL